MSPRAAKIAIVAIAVGITAGVAVCARVQYLHSAEYRLEKKRPEYDHALRRAREIVDEAKPKPARPSWW